MKSRGVDGDGLQPYVAPFTGAWIEMAWPGHPPCAACLCGLPVAPFTGAWIEIQTDRHGAGDPGVAPFTGAWIEILPTAARWLT